MLSLVYNCIVAVGDILINVVPPGWWIGKDAPEGTCKNLPVSAIAREGLSLDGGEYRLAGVYSM